MAGALSDVIPLALVVALSPLPVLAALLMLLSAHELANARAFLLGWTTSLAAVTTAAVLAGASVHASDPPLLVRAGEGVTGAALLVVAGLAWRGRRRPSLRGSRWLAAVDGITAPRACGLAVALVLLNVKVAAITVAAGTVISDAALPAGQTAMAVAAHTALAGAAVGGAGAGAAGARPRAGPRLRRLHDWFERNGTAIVAVWAAGAGVLFVVTALARA